MIGCAQIQCDPLRGIWLVRQRAAIAMDGRQRPVGWVGKHRIRNPLRVPIIEIQQAHAPIGRVAPRAGFAGFCPDTNLPKTLLPGSQRAARILYVQRTVGCNLATVPQITMIARQQLLRRGHQHLISDLFFTSLIGIDDPTQTRFWQVNSLWIAPPFALQIAKQNRSAKSF